MAGVIRFSYAKQPGGSLKFFFLSLFCCPVAVFLPEPGRQDFAKHQLIDFQWFNVMWLKILHDSYEIERCKLLIISELVKWVIIIIYITLCKT